ncbi:MAG TPA: 1-acyl-sn-glycerol-3-phosphate acyltransferase, partial [Nordella sp.]|nr:1-acyl-sn-glycerol-3-phosphate acyltransferase [Nordella sp.]
DVFLKRLVDVMESASDSLLVETVRNNPHVPLPPTAAQRLRELQAQA